MEKGDTAPLDLGTHNSNNDKDVGIFQIGQSRVFNNVILYKHFSPINIYRLPGLGVLLLHGAGHSHIQRTIKIPALQCRNCSSGSGFDKTGSRALTQLVFAREDSHHKHRGPAVPTGFNDNLSDRRLEAIAGS
jgi:hypothetical protein